MNGYLIHRFNGNVSINKRKVDEPRCAKEKRTLRKQAEARTHFVSMAKEAHDKKGRSVRNERRKWSN